MFAKFNLKVSEPCSISNPEFCTAGIELSKDNERRIHTELDKFLLPDGVIDATRLENEWFPTIDADIFLSHSHRDEKLALAIAGYLRQKLNINTFIDSCVWGYANNLLKEIDDTYCKDPPDEHGKVHYNYNKRNASTAHVHLLLSCALAKMIDRTECIIFLNTPQSIMTNSTDLLNKTSSPWIYHELVIAGLCKRRPPHVMVHDTFTAERRDDLRVAYDANLKGFKALDIKELTEMDSLEGLYIRKGLLKR